MRNQLPVRSTQFSFPMSISKCAMALLCCAFSIEPLFAQELDWAANGNDVSNSRFQSIDQITPANVSQLKEAWVFHTGTTNPRKSCLVDSHSYLGPQLGRDSRRRSGVLRRQ
jgi:glucose dehydrogenase